MSFVLKIGYGSKGTKTFDGHAATRLTSLWTAFARSK